MNPFGSESGGAEAYAPPFGLSHKFDTQRKNEVKKALQKTRQVPANVPVDECNPSGDGSISFDEVNQQSHYQSYSPTSTSAAVFRATAAFKSLPSQDAWIMDDICNRKLSRRVRVIHAAANLIKITFLGSWMPMCCGCAGTAWMQ